ncbi:hypothetical protein [Spirosoma utsteinense]|uniref:Glycosyl hydrolase n=1 Tax=Spirosoma utsteinense TaxID=2585773 RepID=A0ABR6WB16_9BACT|nr:hypothetical protein [Spirosoma utsteinense]MBC3786832.1 hypothetical protein [Spirosoma utsteinense]MBC3793747.1 hypothetical protein [Spirosoma utsteinense]
MRCFNVFFIFLLVLSCKEEQSVAQTVTSRYVNLAHLDRLYQAVRLPNGSEVGTVGIYSEAPDYRLVTDADEGFTCIDDVSRAAMLLLREPDLTTSADKQAKLRTMTEFVLQLQSDEGYFYNFLWPDRSINKTFKTSVAEPNFWSWRALWYLTDAYPYYQRADPALASRIETSTQKLTTLIVRDFGRRRQEFTVVKGVQVPKWLPFGSGSDQAAMLLISLTTLQQRTPTADKLTLIELLGEGILAMQYGGPGQYPYGAILSFENNWHAYASDQAYALLRAGKALNKPAWQAAARREIDNFYPYLLREGLLESLAIEQTGNEWKAIDTRKFSQIAYGVRPMVWAALEAYDQTKDARYADMAVQFAGWFLGKNPAGVIMYDRATGRGYDGIGANGVINKNAGAESTIESLWAFQRLEQYPEVLNKLN